ncbi:plasmid mobilization protein [Streptomyces sp. WG-D5]
MDGSTALLRELFTPDEYAAVRSHADHLGVTVTEYVRSSAAERALERLHVTRALESRAPHPGKLPIPHVERSHGSDGASSPALDRFLDTLAHPHPTESG